MTKLNNDFQCTACGASRKRKMLSYTENHVPYCSSYWTCNHDHPNHPKNIDKRGGTFKLYSFEEVQKTLSDQLSEEQFTFIQNLVKNPFSFRLNDYRVILFLLDMQKEKGLESFADTIRYCITYTMNDAIPTETEPKPQAKTVQVSTDNFTF